MGTRAARYLRTTLIAGSVYELSETAGEAANTATIARYVVGGTSQSRQFQPLAATTMSVTRPAVGAAWPNDWGWRDAPALDTVDAHTIAAGTWNVYLDCKRSGQALEVDQKSDTTVIVYRTNSAGVQQQEIGRATVRFIWTTTLTERTFSFTAEAISFAAGDKVKIHVHVTSLDALNIDNSPAVATDLIIEINTNSSSSRMDALTYSAQFARTISPPDSAPGTDATTRALTGARALADAVTGADTNARVLTGARALADTTTISDSLARALTGARALADAAPGTNALTRAGTFARTFTDAAPGTDATTREATFPRTISDAVAGTDQLTRVASFPRAPADSALVIEALAQAGTFARSFTDSAPGADDLARQIIYGRALRETIGTDPNDVVDTPARQIAGVVRDSAGVVVAGAVVKLFRQGDDRAVRETTSAADGTYSFTRDLFDAAPYYVVAYKTGVVPQVHGVSDRDLTPTPL